MKKYLVGIGVIFALAIAGQIALAAATPPALGGTGSTSTPITGQVLIGTQAGLYAPSSTVNASSVIASFTDRGGQYFNVKAYGAKGDGVSDDTSAVNAADAAMAKANVSSTGGCVLFPAGRYVIRPVFIESQNPCWVGLGWSIPKPALTNGVFPGLSLSTIVAASTTPANAYILTINNSSTMIGGISIHDIALDGLTPWNLGVSNFGGIHLANAVFFNLFNFSMNNFNGNFVQIDEASSSYSVPSTSQGWIHDFTMFSGGLNGINFGAGIFASDFYIHDFWMSGFGSGNCINESTTGTGFFSTYFYTGTCDVSGGGVLTTSYETHIFDLNITNSWNNGIEVNQHAAFGYVSDIHDNIVRDYDRNLNGSAGIKIDSGTYDYSLYNNTTIGVNITPQIGIDVVDGIDSTHRIVIDPSNYSRNNTYNFDLASTTYTSTNFVDLQPHGGSVSVGTTSTAATLNVSGTALVSGNLNSSGTLSQSGVPVLANTSVTAQAPITWSGSNVIGYNTSTAMLLNALYTFLNGITVSGIGTFTSSTYFTAPVTVSSTLAVSSTINGFYFGIGAAGVTTNFGITSVPLIVAGDNNLAIGQGVMQAATSTSRDVGIGSQALHSITSAGFNTAVGSLALTGLTSGSGGNTAVGYQAFQALSTGDNGTAIGVTALDQATSFGNTAVGSKAGHSLTTGNSNVFIGRDAGSNASQKVDAVNSMALGQGAFTTASNQVILGNNSVTTVGIGTPSPSSSLQVVDPVNNSSTIRIGAVNKFSCLEMTDASNTANLYYLFISNGVVTSTPTKPTFCQ